MWKKTDLLWLILQCHTHISQSALSANVLLFILQKIALEDDFLSDIGTNLTVFAPNNSAVIDFLRDTDSAWTKEENLLTLLR